MNLNKVIFHNKIPKNELPKVLAACDVGMVILSHELTSIVDTACSNKFFDYMAAGRVVLLNFGGWQNRNLLKIKMPV